MKQEDVLLYRALKAQIRYHKYCYYELHSEQITDKEYDDIEELFDRLAKKLKWEGSWVGYNPEK